MSQLPALIDMPTIKDAPFKRLKMAHRQVIALHVQGRASSEIDRLLQKTPGFASRVLRNDAVRPVLEAIYKDHEVEMNGLWPMAVSTLRQHMMSIDGSIALRAVDLLFKVTGKYAKAEAEHASAEDIIVRVLEQISPDGTRQRLATRHILRSVVHKMDTEGDVVDAEVVSEDAKGRVQDTALAATSPTLPHQAQGLVDHPPQGVGENPNADLSSQRADNISGPVRGDGHLPGTDQMDSGLS